MKLSKGQKYAVIAVAVIIALLCIWDYNALEGRNEAVLKAWTPLSAKLDARYDAVPDLAQDVVAYADKEDSFITDIKSARDRYEKEDRIGPRVKAANDVEQAISRVFLEVSEKYPSIASYYQFMALKDRFQSSEAGMGVEMSAYNNAVDSYNTYAHAFPNDIVALVLGFPSSAVYFKEEKAQ